MKRKVEGEFQPEIFERVESLKTEYLNQLPYQHCVINELVNDDLLRQVRQEILHNLQFTIKETDIYKVNQTGDLLNLDKLDKKELLKLESLFKLRNAIYSPEFRAFIEQVVGIRGLSATNVDVSINNYSNGCHLLNHDDVIGTRAVSFILYLPDPDKEWLDSDGGKLELYPVKSRGIPENKPSKIIRPYWNTFAFFAVQPGYSFHSVEEVVGDKQRLSISGWFHFSEKETGGDLPKSTLDQLLQESSIPLLPYNDDGDIIAEHDLIVLKKYLNPVYLKQGAINSVGNIFDSENSVQLHSFLNKQVESVLENALSQLDNELLPGIQKHDTGIPLKWQVRGPPHIMRYVKMDSSTTDNSATNDDIDGVLRGLKEFFEGSSFRKWLIQVTNLTPKSKKVEFRRFRPSLDYTLALSSSKPLLDVNLCMTKNHELWESGEVGGYLNYLANTEDGDAAVYSKTEQEDSLLTTSASWNQLNIVKREAGTLKFVKYISASAPGSRWDIDCELEFSE